MAERFRTTWRGWIKSSEGFSVRIGSRTGVDFRDWAGEIHIDSERMARPGNEVVIYISSIPDTVERPRGDVIVRLQRAFGSAGVDLILDDSEYQS